MTLLRSNYNPLMPQFFDDYITKGLFDVSIKDRFWKKMAMPSVNMNLTDTHCNIEVVAPGLEKDDFNISLQDNILTISSEKADKIEDMSDQYAMFEFCRDSFTRSIQLPDNVLTDEVIEAQYENGILKIMVPRKMEHHETATKKIFIK